MTAHLFDALQVLLAAAEVVCKGDKMTSLQKTVKIQKKKEKKKNNHGLFYTLMCLSSDLVSPFQ